MESEEGVVLNKFNVGILPTIKNGRKCFLLIGGEKASGGETTEVLLLEIKDKIYITKTKVELPEPCSFIDKNFIKLAEDKYGQFDMKKTNFFVYDGTDCVFTVKSIKGTNVSKPCDKSKQIYSN